MKDFRSLKVWEKAHAYTLAIYARTEGFPSNERFGMINQMRRSAYSIPTNISEGCGASSDADFARFLQIAMKSACEAEYQLVLSRDLGYITEENDLEDRIVEIKKMLATFINKLRNG
jgi:four helix bundle protein